MNSPLDPKRTVAELKELRKLTSDENGAQRVAFTETWTRARAWLRKRLEGLLVLGRECLEGRLLNLRRGWRQHLDAWRRLDVRRARR